MEQLDLLSNRFIVMAERGRDLLETVYGVAPEKIDLIPHGVIDMPFIDSNFYKDLFGVEGKTVLLTFGLLSPNKGIEYVIEAMPAILERHPNVVYHRARRDASAPDRARRRGLPARSSSGWPRNAASRTASSSTTAS